MPSYTRNKSIANLWLDFTLEYEENDFKICVFPLNS